MSLMQPAAEMATGKLDLETDIEAPAEGLAEKDEGEK